MEDVVMARSGLNSGKASGGGSPLVNEWIKSMPVTLMFWFVEVFNACMLGQKIEVMQSWQLLILILLRKNPRACKFGDFRGIVLLECMSKFYMSVVMNVVRRTTPLRGWRRQVCNYAYTPKCCTAHVSLLMSTLFHRAREWTNEIAFLV